MIIQRLLSAILCLFLAPQFVYSNIPIRCNHITTLDGLSNNSVRAIAQDQNGFIWFGTNEGLNRYDGVNFTIFKYDPYEIDSLSSNLVMYLLVDRQGFLWIATDDGLNRWDPATGKITRFPSSAPSHDRPGANFILTLFEDSLGRIWVGTVNGLRVFSHETNEFKNYYHDPNDPATLSLSHINDVFEDHNHTIWVATHGKGMNRLNDDGETFTRIMPDQDDLTPSIPWTPTCIYEDSKNRYWVGTWDKGLLRFDPVNMSFEPVDEMRTVNVRFVREDQYGNLWVGTLGNGLYYLDALSEQFSVYQSDPIVDSGLSSDKIYSFFQDRNELFFVGTANGGANTFRHPKYQIQHYQPNSISNTSLSDKSITSILEAYDGIVWIGTQDHGLDRFDPSTGEYKNYIYATEENKPHIDTVVVNYIYSIKELGDGRLLIGTLGYGLGVFDPTTEQFNFFYGEESLPYIGYHNSIKDIVIDKQNQIWVCNDNGYVLCLDTTFKIKKIYGDKPNTFSYPRLTALEFQDDQNLLVGAESEGLNLLNIETGEISYFKHDPYNPDSISDNTTWDILSDHQGQIWIGTDAGLNLFHPNSGEFEDITELHKFPSRAVLGIVEDNNGNLWLGTNRGLVRYDPSINKADLYRHHNGIQGYEFTPRSSFVSSNGKLYFGGNYGFNIIDADTFRDYPNRSPILLSNIRIEGEKYPSDPLIWKTDSFELPYSKNDLALRFVLLDYTVSSKNTLEYKMGDSNDWMAINNSQEILFADMSPGKRKLIIRGANADGTLGSYTKELTVTVLPPYWMTWQFRTLAVFAVCILIYLGYKSRVRRIAKHNEELKNEVEEQIARLKILSGLMPICSYCKKVRDDTGYWNQVEAYIQAHSQAEFSHGICPECMEEHFSEFSDLKSKEQRNNDNEHKN
ncbi:MAG: two-component regulator propeller domain-containing protein [Candidatus Hinthialibacter antarcticus]|nr:two-component regulator propeller domain-containing protein [Candidatus Hinthialibacter antarcticus]